MVAAAVMWLAIALLLAHAPDFAVAQGSPTSKSPPKKAPGSKPAPRSTARSTPGPAALTFPAAKPGGYSEVSVSQLKDYLASGLDFSVVDVREEAEWEAAHLKPAAARADRLFLIPLSSGQLREDSTRGWRRLPPYRPVFVICRSGSRSLVATQFLAETWVYSVVINVQGGMNAVQAAYPQLVEGGAGPYPGDPPYVVPGAKLGGYWDINVLVLRQWLEAGKDMTVVDVRAGALLQQARIPDAYTTLLNIPLAELIGKGRFKEIPTTKPVAFICTVTSASEAAAEALARLRTHPVVLNVVGGMGEWLMLRLPTSSGPLPAA